MNTPDSDSLKQLDNLLAISHQAWLFGAGISLDAGIPLMDALTSRIFAMAHKEPDSFGADVLLAVRKELPGDSHIEHILSHLGDYITLAERSRERDVTIGGTRLKTDSIYELYAKVLQWIAEIIRWGYRPKNGEKDELGTRNKPIVEIDSHRKFIDALFNRGQAGIAERRRAVRLFTTNYDTLLEDALSLSCCSYWDGFSGGAVAYRDYCYGQDEPEDSLYRALVIKLHGSIDWQLDEYGRVLRVRDGDLYPDKSSRVLIYPQATKYLATQRDPFAAQFDLFRRTLGSARENVLAVCGYSFGDDHINDEIDLALRHPDNRTTILAFTKNINPVLKEWGSSVWAKRLYMITSQGLYIGDKGPFSPPPSDKTWDWWTFNGVTRILNSGAEACLE